MSTYETSITNSKKQLEFYKDLTEQLLEENKSLKRQLKSIGGKSTITYSKMEGGYICCHTNGETYKNLKSLEEDFSRNRQISYFENIEKSGINE